MSFIGIITNVKNMEYMSKSLERYFDREKIIFITDKSIHNMRNIRFETIIIDDKITHVSDLKYIVSNAKYVILNSDLDLDLNALENLNLIVISYGFKQKSTFAISSVSENNMIICLQRMLVNSVGKKIEPQEFNVEIIQNTNLHAAICIQILLMIYQKIET